MPNSILRCEKCENNKFFIFRYDEDLIIECVNCGEEIKLEGDVKIKDVIKRFKNKESVLRWYDIYM